MQVSLSARGLHSDNHYNGTIPQRQRQEAGTYVVNEQHIYDLSISYALTQRLQLNLGIPWIDSSWSIPTPITTPGPRAEQNGRGIGDISISGRYWMLDPHRHSKGNFSLGLGCKLPTGESAQKDSYPDLLTGANDTSKVVDQSVQPGDGGWGISFELQGYRQWKYASWYGYANYLANPRDRNDADSIIVGLGFGATADPDLLKNSVPDSYLVRTGVSFPLHAGLSGSLGFRVEGLPRYDLIGDSHGWRRPGYESFFEPGIVFSHGASTFALHVPIAMVRNRQVNPYTGFPGDATFPDVIILAGYSYRFGPPGGGPPDG